ncbi:MAG: DUF721 domain-containing protein [Thermoleophilaceae bacterium]|nr:DUF721 domain-containing protein [Thermoleophilaceae bacterium]
MRRLAPRGLGPALQKMTAGLAPPTLLGRVQKVWPQAVGEALAQRARPVSERAGELVLECEDAVWAEEIRLMSLELLEQLNAALGEGAVASIRTVSGGTRKRR